MSRLRGLWLLTLPLLAAGCGDRFGFRNYEPDAVATRESGTVMVPYDDVQPAVTPDDTRLAQDLRRGLRQPEPVEVQLPGGVEKPWTEPPRTNPTAWKEAPEQSPASATSGSGLVASEGGLAAGDAVEVLVERHPEFSGQWRVGGEGRLVIPAAGAFGTELLTPELFSRRVGRVAGMSPEDLAAGIARELKTYLVRLPDVKVTAASAGPRRER